MTKLPHELHLEPLCFECISLRPSSTVPTISLGMMSEHSAKFVAFGGVATICISSTTDSAASSHGTRVRDSRRGIRIFDVQALRGSNTSAQTRPMQSADPAPVSVVSKFKSRSPSGTLCQDLAAGDLAKARVGQNARGDVLAGIRAKDQLWMNFKNQYGVPHAAQRNPGSKLRAPERESRALGACTDAVATKEMGVPIQCEGANRSTKAGREPWTRRQAALGCNAPQTAKRDLGGVGPASGGRRKMEGHCAAACAAVVREPGPVRGVRQLDGSPKLRYQLLPGATERYSATAQNGQHQGLLMRGLRGAWAYVPTRSSIWSRDAVPIIGWSYFRSVENIIEKALQATLITYP
ncbi:hypothetical protein B0H17DRAFT_1144405 [Mycena rosella]|uniref:Uncharacterized protein n=1 Tax=Mycena rosella TaxID=1033263 RepID=A0AAD7CTA2_MYCRO|nr:hypothetical protein B0H17DRAFT_1144405 [Mycena rosella]